MRLTKQQYIDWKNQIDKTLDEINAYSGLIGEDMYRLTWRGKNHRLWLVHGEKLVAHKIPDINYCVEMLVKKYVRK